MSYPSPSEEVSTIEKVIHFDPFSTETNQGNPIKSLPLLPPRGIFVPTSMIFHMQIPSATLVTWIQVRSLAWSGWSTPPLSLSEIASIIGIHPTRLSRHLSQLESISALTLRTHGNGKIIISFPAEPTVELENQGMVTNKIDPQTNTPKEQTAVGTPSYFPDRILGYLSY